MNVNYRYIFVFTIVKELQRDLYIHGFGRDEETRFKT